MVFFNSPDIRFIASRKNVSGIRAESNTKHALHSASVVHLPAGKNKSSVGIHEKAHAKLSPIYNSQLPLAFR